MHLPDGLVPLPVLAGGTAIAVGALARGLRDLTPDKLPAAAMTTTVLFVASLLHIPIGPVQWHLVLNGLAGLLLGWAVFPALLVALTLQAVLFGYGGLTVLGLNTLIMAAPGLLVHRLIRRPLARATSPRLTLILGAAAGSLGIACAVALLALVLLSAGRSFTTLAGAVAVANLPLLAIEAAVTAAAVGFLARVRPELLGAPRP
jgi:cobalt/nickel transport system permease protein